MDQREPARLAVLGSPIAHSKSPQIHTAAYGVLGLDWAYSAIECDAAGLEPLLAGLDSSWRGLSLTMPLKEEAHRIAAVLDPVARESGVVNTLLRLPGGAGWAGFNTDVGGLAAAISRKGLDVSRVVVLGAGATAVSAILACRKLGAQQAGGPGAQQITVMSRRIEAARALADRFDGSAEQGSAVPGSAVPGSVPVEVRAEVLVAQPQEARPQEARPIVAEPEAFGEPTLIVSTLPASAVSQGVRFAPVGLAPVFDVAYDPWPSPLAVQSEAVGQAAYCGVDMLLEQAVLQLRIFVCGDPTIALPDEARVREAMSVAARS